MKSLLAAMAISMAVATVSIVLAPQEASAACKKGVNCKKGTAVSKSAGKESGSWCSMWIRRTCSSEPRR